MKCYVESFNLSITTVVFLQSLPGPQSASQVVETLVARFSAVTEKRGELVTQETSLVNILIEMPVMRASGCPSLPSPPPFPLVWNCEKRKKAKASVSTNCHRLQF